MDSALLLHRLHFAFTITYHYLFPQLTMGLALLIFLWKTMALRTGDESYDRAARFWTKVFGINFTLGVVTGIPMEFQFGTNWAQFSRAAGGVIGQTLAMEGVFSFFLESSFLGFLLFGEKLLGRVGHWFASLCVFTGSWLSGYFIVATDAWMQNPVGYTQDAAGNLQLESIWALLLNPWLLWQYPHTMIGSVVTASFVVASIAAAYLLLGRHQEQAAVFLRLAVPVGALAALLMAFPTGDGQGKLVAHHQPVTLAAMEGHFHTQEGAPIVLIGQPDMDNLKLDNPIYVPRMLSFLTYQRWDAEIKGLLDFPKDEWPDNIPLLYYSYHVMVGLGTIFIAVMACCAVLLWRKRLFETRWALWILAMMLPFPYIANTAGWMTAELGRQPWVIFGLMRTADGHSANVSAGNALFSLIGFMGMYTVLSILFLFLMYRQIDHGPEPRAAGETDSSLNEAA
ncbi:MAG: cytochrome ubiquinol oxidase subunit I [Bryobacterales bacterium]